MNAMSWLPYMQLGRVKHVHAQDGAIQIHRPSTGSRWTKMVMQAEDAGW